MTVATSITGDYFLSSLTLPIHLIMVKFAVSSASQVADLLLFKQRDRYNLEVAVENAFCNAVRSFSDHPQENERIHINFFIEEEFLVISIRENGIPFDLQQTDSYTPDSMDGMDSVELLIHGRKGKETRLKKKLNHRNLPQELLESTTRKRGKKRPTVKNAIIRPAKQDELAEIGRLAWRCYGYTQENLLYDLDLLTEKFISGEFKPVVAFDPASGNMIAHGGLKYHDPNVKVSEEGFGFIDPAYRCPGLSAQMLRVIIDISRENGDMGMFDCSVTTHTLSQKAIQGIGAKPCSLLMGIAATGMQIKELTTTTQQKGTVLSHYIAFDHSEKTIYVSPHHQEMVAEIYQWLNLPRKHGTPDMQTPSGPSSISMFSLPDEFNVVFIIVHTIGKDTVKEVYDAMVQCKKELRDAVYAFLPLGTPASPYLVEQFEHLNLSFAGIMPHIHDGDDRILLQWVNIPLDMEKIRVYSEMSRKLFSYIKEEQQRHLPP